MIYNQKEVAGGTAMADLKSKSRMHEVNGLKRGELEASILDDSQDDSGSGDDNVGDSKDFLQQLDVIGTEATPGRMLDHYQQMQDDLIELRYFIQQHYREVVEIPGMQRAEQYQQNWEKIEAQSHTLQEKIKQTEFQILPAIPSQVSSMPGSASRTALSKAVSMQSLQTERQDTQGVDQEVRFKQTQLLNLKQALDLNEEALREELYIDDKHREF